MNGYLKLSFIFWGTLLAYCVFIIALLANYAGNNPLNKFNSRSLHFISIFPEGWAFFTKTAKEPVFTLYRVENETLKRVDLRSFQPRFFWGASRNNRLLNIEMGNIIRKINSNTSDRIRYQQTIKFRDNISNYLSTDTLKFNDIKMDKQIKLMHGKYLIVIESFLPWSILRRKDEFEVKQKLTLIPVFIK